MAKTHDPKSSRNRRDRVGCGPAGAADGPISAVAVDSDQIGRKDMAPLQAASRHPIALPDTTRVAPGGSALWGCRVPPALVGLTSWSSHRRRRGSGAPQCASDRRGPSNKKGGGSFRLSAPEVPWAGLRRAVRGRAIQVVSRKLAFGTPPDRTARPLQRPEPRDRFTSNLQRNTLIQVVP